MTLSKRKIKNGLKRLDELNDVAAKTREECAALADNWYEETGVVEFRIIAEEIRDLA
mgnify:CR=1 FL=1|jgi:hypothetical protein